MICREMNPRRQSKCAVIGIFISGVADESRDIDTDYCNRMNYRTAWVQVREKYIRRDAYEKALKEKDNYS